MRHLLITGIAGAMLALAAQDAGAQTQRFEELGCRVYADCAAPRRGDKQADTAAAATAAWAQPAEAETRAYRSEMHDILSAAILSALGKAENPDPSTVKARIKAAEGRLYRERSGSKHPLPFVHVADTNRGRIVVVAFEWPEGGSAIPRMQPYLQFYTRATGGWQMKAEAPRDFEDRAIEIVPLPSPLSDEVWVLVWGMVIGDTGARRNVRLYAFDGEQVRTVYRKDDLRGGRVEVAGSKILLTYDEKSTRREIHEELYITPDGLK